MGNEQSFESRGVRVRSRSQPRPSKSDTSVSVDSTDADRSATSATTPVTPSVSSKRLKDLDSSSLELSTVSSSSAHATPHATPKKLIRQKRAPSLSNTQEPEENTLASTVKLSAYQVQMLAQSWPRIQQTGGHVVGAKFFKHLCQKNSQAKEIFQKATIIEGFSQRTPGRCMDVYKEHGRQLFDLLNEAIKCLNEPVTDVIASCRQIGAKHSSLKGEGFQTAIWDDLAELLVDHITKLDAVRKHREVSKAWTALISFMVERIKDGYSFGPRKSSTPSVDKLKTCSTGDSLSAHSEPNQDTSNKDVPM